MNATNAEEYYRIMYNEFMSHGICQLESRFLDNSAHIVGLLYLLPSECTRTDFTIDDGIPSNLTEAVQFYKSDLPQPVLFPTEYHMWVMTWKQQGHGPKKLVDALHACDRTSFPNTV